MVWFYYVPDLNVSDAGGQGVLRDGYFKTRIALKESASEQARYLSPRPAQGPYLRLLEII